MGRRSKTTKTALSSGSLPVSLTHARVEDMNTPQSVALGWGVLMFVPRLIPARRSALAFLDACADDDLLTNRAAAGGGYYLAKQDINQRRRAQAQDGRRAKGKDRERP